MPYNPVRPAWAGRGSRLSEKVRYRCGACGNLTRFDVYESRRSRSFYHYTLGGELEIEDQEAISHEVEKVVCRWCGSSDSIEEIPEVGAVDSGAEQ